MKRCLLLLSLIALTDSVFAAELPYVPVNCIQRTMKALAESTPERPAAVRIAFYGQSIVAQGWTDLVVSNLQSRFPSARLTVEKRAIGGYQSQALSRTAEHDLYPFYPDLTFFHVYGPLAKYEEIVRTLRERTTSEIVLWSSHVSHDQKPADMLAMRDMRTVGIRAIAAKYHCHYIDLNAKWARMMVEKNLTNSDLLCDVVHLKRESLPLYADFISEELVRVPGLSGESDYSGTIRTIPFTKKSVTFTGNRVVAVSSGKATAPVAVALDGRKPSSFPEMWSFTRPSRGPAWMPMVNRVESRALPVAETWTLTFLSGGTMGFPTNDVPPVIPYAVCGSVTGPDGTGWNTNDFTSSSGRVAIRAKDFAAWQFKMFKKEPKPGFSVTWESRLLGTDALVPTAEGVRTVLAQGCTNGTHELTLTSAAGGSSGVAALIVHEPPRNFTAAAREGTLPGGRVDAVWLTHATETPTKTVVSWHTTEPGPSRVAYGDDANVAKTAGSDAVGFLHHVEIPSATPGRPVFYRVESGDMRSPVRSFTPAGPDHVRVAVVADIGYICRGKKRKSVASFDYLKADRPDLLLTAGDNVSAVMAPKAQAGALDYAEPFLKFIREQPELFASTPILPSLGNHDKQVGPRHNRRPGRSNETYEIDATAYSRVFRLPAPGWRWEFRIPQADVTFFSLDAEHLVDVGTTFQSCHDIGETSEQFRWYDERSAARKTKWGVTLFNEEAKLFRGCCKGAWHRMMARGTIGISGYGYYALRAEMPDGMIYYNTCIADPNGFVYHDPSEKLIEASSNYMLLDFDCKAKTMTVRLKESGTGRLIDEKTFR